MKKIIAIILTLTICLSFAACGETSNLSDSTTTPSVPGDTIASDSTGDTTESEKGYSEIELTMDNWSTYLEFSSKYSAYYKESAFSDTEKEINGVSQDFYFGVKDEYSSRLDTERSTITVQISTDFGTQAGAFADDYSSFDPNGNFVNYQNMTMESSEFQVTDHGSFAWHISSAAASSKSELETGELFKWLKNQQVLNITGTLYIAE